MRRLVLLVFLLLSVRAYANCPAVPGDCPSPTFNNLTTLGTYNPSSISTSTLSASSLTVSGGGTLGGTFSVGGAFFSLGSNGVFSLGNASGNANIVQFTDRASGGTPTVSLTMLNGTAGGKTFAFGTAGSSTDRSISFTPAGAGNVAVLGQFIGNTINANGGGSGITWSGSTIPNNFMAFSSSAGILGTTTASSPIFENSFAIPTDTLTTPVNASVYGWGFANNGSTGYTGNRATAKFVFTQNGTSGNKVAGQNVSVATGVNITAQATASEGGTGTGFSTAYGQLFGENIVATLGNGATNWQEAHASEFDMNAVTGSSVYKKTVVQIVGGTGETVKGASGNDIMLLFAQQEAGSSTSPTANYDTGVQFGDVGSSWPFASTASLIGIGEPQNVGSASYRQAIVGYGVNFGATEFNTASWKAMGSKIDGSGNGILQGLTLQNWGLTISSTGTLQINSANKTTTSISLHAGGGGSGWNVGDKFTWGATGVGKVTTTNGSGVVTAVSQLVPDSESSPCASACATTATNNSDAHAGGTSLTIDSTAVGPGNLLIGSGSALATNATTGFPLVPTMAGAPTGTVGAAGQAALVIDTTNKKICYTIGGGTWECSGAFTP